MAALWWKFSTGGLGTHLVRVTDVGTPGQQVWLDGTLLDAPPDTTVFTGPGGSLLELREMVEGNWALYVDGVPAETYSPDHGASHDVPGATWWKFTLHGMGTHHLRVTNLGLPGQQVFLDGTRLDAPEGTLAFTGPGGCLLDLQKPHGQWVLLVDGAPVPQHSSTSDPSDPMHVWNFFLPSTGSHQVRVAHIGQPGQEIFLDQVLVPAPEGTTTFTGPQGTLLELRRRGDEWVLAVDGVEVQSSAGGPLAGPAEASWSFLVPSTGTSHQMRVSSLGGPGQQVFIDGTLVPAPEGTTTFTGPGGTLLELRPTGHAWSLFIDGFGLEDWNSRSSALMASGPTAAAASPTRAAVDTGGALPQGVSYEAETGKYKANIKVGGRFKFLGDFATAEEAHERYLAAKKELG